MGTNAPTASPTDPPTNAPTDAPTNAPVVPTAPPTTGTPTCTELVHCDCVSGCVKELTFMYTGKDCPQSQKLSGQCNDETFSSAFNAGYQIALPDKLTASIMLDNGVVTQTFTIDATCDGGQGL